MRINHHGLMPEPKMKETDHILGVSDVAPIITNDPLNFWQQEKFNPTNSYQVDRNGEDLMACVPFSINDGYERFFNYLISIDPSVKTTLADLGCIDDFGEVHFSDSFTAVISNTSPYNGNSVTAVCDAVHSFGLLGYNIRPWNQTMTKSEFYKSLTQEEKDQAKKILDFFDLKHAWLTTGSVGNMTGSTAVEYIKKALCKGLVRVSVDGGAYYEKDSNGYIVGCDNYTHSVLHIGGVEASYNLIHDHYQNQYPKFGWNYPFGAGKLLYVVVKKKLKLVKKQGSPAVYLYSLILDKYFPISDGDTKNSDGTPVISGGDIVHQFSGNNYPVIEVLDNIPEDRIGNPIKQS